MNNISTIPQLQSDWFSLHDLDRAAAIRSIHNSGISIRHNREYSRFFGQPPMRDIKAVRGRTVCGKPVVYRTDEVFLN